MKKLLQLAFNSEVPDISERYRIFASALVVIFTISYSIGFLQLLHLGPYLGPGLGDQVSFQPLLNSLNDLNANNPGLWLALMALLSFTILFRLAAMLGGYFLFEREEGEPYPIKWIVVFFLTNMLSTFAIPLMLLALGGLFFLSGLDFAIGWHWVDHNVRIAHQLVMDYVPTLVNAPAPLAVLIIAVISGFFHYWFHRLGHTQRFLWLMFHRPHHMTPALIQSTTMAVFTALPLFIFVVLPYNLVFAACTKLFSSEPLYTAVIVYNCLILIPEIFGHQTALYRMASRNRLIRLASFISGGGVYHYMHHSSEPEHCGRSGAVNLVNIGGGPLFIWDIIFGTYCSLSPKTPRAGLSGQPELHLNPLRLTLAGVAQVCSELLSNPSWREKWRIITASSDYSPPVSTDFAVKEQRTTHKQATPPAAASHGYSFSSGAEVIANAGAKSATAPRS
ncbi:sterol desaturase family protein [Zhongshania arctica]|uniref:Sterol desaturase family protein n=1 Tax=Zhongshania arctica TaxID=3238302 RepID=A0ABV3TU02_9GAMM